MFFFYLKSQHDWSDFALLLPNVNVFPLKFHLFKHLNPSLALNRWDRNRDELLKQSLKYVILLENPSYLIFRKINGEVFNNHTIKFSVNWKVVAIECNKKIEQISLFVTGKQCRERWFNYLCPFLRK